jgi:hypothetical protein
MISPRSERRARSDALARSPRGSARGIQIGPRIRVGGTIGKIGQEIKIGAGKVASNPLVQGVAGAFFGPLAGAGLGVLGKELDTSNGYTGVGDILKGGLAGGAAGAAGSGIKTGVTSLLGKAIPSATEGGAAGSGWLDKAKSIFSGGGMDGQGNFGLAGDLAGKLGGQAGSLLGGQAGGTLDKVLLGASIADAALQRKRQMDLQDKGIDYATNAYSERAPLRTRGLQLMMDESAPDLSAIFQNSHNPYTKPVIHPTIGAGVPAKAG